MFPSHCYLNIPILASTLVTVSTILRSTEANYILLIIPEKEDSWVCTIYSEPQLVIEKWLLLNAVYSKCCSLSKFELTLHLFTFIAEHLEQVYKPGVNVFFLSNPNCTIERKIKIVILYAFKLDLAKYSSNVSWKLNSWKTIEILSKEHQNFSCIYENEKQ